jgi:DNA-binding transcriptional LysR family regulator
MAPTCSSPLRAFEAAMRTGSFRLAATTSA